MKIKTVIISLVVTGSLIAGGVYGASYAVKNSKDPVEVTLVSNVAEQDYFSDMSEYYGTVTSQVSQQIELDDEYKINKIYVKKGDKVKEGTPLFEYDMTLQELEYEVAKLNLQVRKLKLEKKEKQLTKLKNGTASATIEDDDDDLTAAADEPSGADEGDLSTEEIVTPEEVNEPTASEETVDLDEAEIAEMTDINGTASDTSAGSELEIAEISDIDPSEDESADSTISIRNSVQSYQGLVDVMYGFFEEYQGEVHAYEVADAIHDAVDHFRKNLADSANTSDGTTYTIKETVKKALSAEELRSLEESVKRMDVCHAKYVDLLILEIKQGGQQSQTEVDSVQKEYDLLSSTARKLVENMDMWQDIVPYEADDEDDETEIVLPSESETTEPEEKESETETEIPDASLVPEAEPESETETASPEEKTYTIYVMDGNQVKVTIPNCAPGEMTPPITANTDDSTRVFVDWTVQPEEVTLIALQPDYTEVQFLMPEEDVHLYMNYILLPQAIQAYLDGFEELYGKAMNKQENDSENEATAGKDRILLFEDAISYYQTWLSMLPELTEENKYSDYTLSKIVRDYLSGNGKENTIEQIENEYKSLCMQYVITLFEMIDPLKIDTELLKQLDAAYRLLGEDWQKELEESRKNEAGEEEKTDSIGDMIEAYKIFVMFQEYKNLSPKTSSEDRLKFLQNIMDAFDLLTDEQKKIIARNEEFVAVMKEFGLWQDLGDESETEDYGDYDDYGGYDDYDGGDYDSEATRQQEIKTIEREIVADKLDIRLAELELDAKKRVVDGKVVKSTVNGTVVSIGDENGQSEYDYFVKVANEDGLYVRGTMNELALQQIQIGDYISGSMMDNGVPFVAVIKEISDYPASSEESSMNFTTENGNASYYPFYALLEDTEDIEEGEATIYLSEAMEDDSFGTLYLQKFFVRTEKNGKSYVFVANEKGVLEKRYVNTGEILYDYLIEIHSGLQTSDKIAFPYGKNVEVGAKVIEVDTLSAINEG